MPHRRVQRGDGPRPLASGEPTLYAVRETLIFAAGMKFMSWGLGTSQQLRTGLKVSLVLSLPYAFVMQNEIDDCMDKLAQPEARGNELGHTFMFGVGIAPFVVWTVGAMLLNDDLREFVTGASACWGALSLPRLWVGTAIMEHKLYNGDADAPAKFHEARERVRAAEARERAEAPLRSESRRSSIMYGRALAVLLFLDPPYQHFD